MNDQKHMQHHAGMNARIYMQDSSKTDANMGVQVLAWLAQITHAHAGSFPSAWAQGSHRGTVRASHQAV